MEPVARARAHTWHGPNCRRRAPETALCQSSERLAPASASESASVGSPPLSHRTRSHRSAGRHSLARSLNSAAAGEWLMQGSRSSLAVANRLVGPKLKRKLANETRAASRRSRHRLSDSILVRLQLRRRTRAACARPQPAPAPPGGARHKEAARSPTQPYGHGPRGAPKIVY